MWWLGPGEGPARPAIPGLLAAPWRPFSTMGNQTQKTLTDKLGNYNFWTQKLCQLNNSEKNCVINGLATKSGQIKNIEQKQANFQDPESAVESAIDVNDKTSVLLKCIEIMKNTILVFCSNSDIWNLHLRIINSSPGNKIQATSFLQQ